jgi:hypothetical protein
MRASTSIAVVFKLVSYQSLYYGKAEPSSPHKKDGTAYNHEENRHKAGARAWWTTTNLQKVGSELGWKTSVELPGKAGRHRSFSECCTHGVSGCV